MQRLIRRTSCLVMACAALAALPRLAAGAEEPGEDHPLLGRFEGARMVAYRQAQFDEYRLLTAAATSYGGIDENLEVTERLEGKVTRITYESGTDASTLEVVSAYRETLEAAGFELLFDCDDGACGGRNFNHAVVPYDLRFGDNYGDQRYLAARLPRPEGEVHAMVYVVGTARGVFSQVDVIEAKPRQRGTVVVDAGQMAQTIGGEGRIALYGIYFATDSAALQAESAPTLEEIGKLLANDRNLSLLVVGHTDDQGEFDYNLDLSRRRAEAVARALEADYGVAAGRLKPWGVGFAAPVASNRSEQGRALNRRVELVER